MLNSTTVDSAARTPGPAPRRERLAVVPTYAEAQEIVDRLADRHFDVRAVQIVGSGLRTVEQVTGRLTTGRAALLGAGGGAWWGAFVGLLLGLFSTAWLAPLVVGVLVGAAFGALMAGVAHAAMRGRRDFRSVQTVSASEYEVLVEVDKVAEAQRLLHV